jgi:hypothetical protein
MTGYPGRRRSNPSDPTAERTSHPVPVRDDVIDRDEGDKDQSDEDDDPVIPDGDVAITKIMIGR